MKNLALLIILNISAVICTAQNFTDILLKIEENNTTLAALREQVAAAKRESRIGLTPDNPEIEFGYLWGTPTTIGNRTDFNITQTFDFPTVYYYKNKIAAGKASKAELDYAVQRKMLLLEARKLCINLVYQNAMRQELLKRVNNAESIAQAYLKKFEAGDCNVLELNKARLNLLSARNTLDNNEIERNLLMAELLRLNGGNAVELTSSVFDSVSLPNDFGIWYAAVESLNPELQSIHLQQEISSRQIQLSKAGWLPQISAGYKSERIAGTTLQGVGVGISIPLWQNKNTVKMEKAQLDALNFVEADARLQYYHSLKAHYDKAVRLQQLSTEYGQFVKDANSIDLLQTALEKGQITLIEYMMEQTIYYEAIEQVLTTEKDFQIAIAELMKWC